MECEVYSVECQVWNLESGVQGGCKVQSVECRVWNVEPGAGSVVCRVQRSVKLGV